MAKLTRRSLLRNSFGLVAAGTLARPYIANAAATTAAVWWVQGFAQEEDVSFKKIALTAIHSPPAKLNDTGLRIFVRSSQT